MAVIKKEDCLKFTAEMIFEKIDSGEFKSVYASAAVIQEVIFWFYSRQLLSELALVVNILTHFRNVEWIPITLRYVLPLHG